MCYLLIEQQVEPHGTAYITGDKKGLIRLRDQINKMLDADLPFSHEDYFCSDGEEFSLHVMESAPELMSNLDPPYYLK